MDVNGRNYFRRVFYILSVMILAVMLAVSASASGSDTDGQSSTAQEESAAYTGWKTVDGKKYYYREGVKVTGWQKISGKYYYFSASGKLQVNKIAGTKKSGYYYVDANGVRVTSAAMKRAVAFVLANSDASQTRRQRLRSCYEAMCKYPYKTYTSVTPDASVLGSYASTVFKYKRGDCHRFAVALVYVAKALGYESRLAESVATGRHALCEVKIGSSWRILAVVIQKMLPNRDLFLVSQKNYPYAFSHDILYTIKAKNGKITWDVKNLG
ncbi:MAG: hypothetical protein LUI13_11620 [Lachnospiraceae bacterium]|nr:hypothetical protein [Lachnospiraceae bacterium]